MPEHDAVVVTFNAGGIGSSFGGVLHTAVIEMLTGRHAEPPMENEPTEISE